MARTTSPGSSLAALVIGALGALSLCACGGDGDGDVPRNVILISLDTLRPDHLGCYGYARPTSPAIDALAARGVRFADASSAAPWTLPSHTTMFTGLYPSHHGVKDYTNRLPDEARTLAEILSERGFQTWAVVNTWNIADPRFEIFQGFDDHAYIKETQKHGGGQTILNTGAQVEARARRYLAERDPARPFFLFAHFYDAHTDFTPEESYRAEFVGPYAGKLDGSTDQLMAIRGRGIRLGEPDLRHLRELYDAEIRQLDDVLAGFLAWLEEQDLARDTLIVLVSDHGEEFQEHGGLLHGRTQYEELLRVPLILAGPGVPRGGVVTQPVGLVDLLPTVLGRLGLTPPAGLDGLDLAGTWGGGTLPERVLYGEADHNNVVDGKPVVDVRQSARLGSEKLHVDHRDGRVELYDLAQDPLEQRDLAAGQPARAERLRAELARFLAGSVAGQQSGAELTGENLELLQKLGYVGDDEPADDGK